MTELNLVGTTLGRFEVISELGRGGMAVVYKARQTDLDRIVALKILPPGLTHDASYVARFRQEARSAARLEHPHIMPVYEVGEASGLHYIAMKFIQGRTLKELAEAEGAMGVPRAAQILAQVGEALDYAHRQGVIHRDIKPSNVMITDEGWVYLTDFGLARGTGASTAGLTMAGTVMGTPEYMSPEQAQGLPNVGPPTDIYALGVMLYELLTGTFPFQADTPMGMLAARLLQAPTPPRDVRGDLPSPVEDVVMRALARKPEARFTSAAAMVTALRQAAGLSEAQAQRPLTPLSGTPAIGETLVANTPPSGAPRVIPPQTGQPVRATPLPPLPPLPQGSQPATPPYVQTPPAMAQAARPAAGAPAAQWQGGLPTQPVGGTPPPPAAPARPPRMGLWIGIGAGALALVFALLGALAFIGRDSGGDTPDTPAGSPVAALVREGDPQLSESASLAQAIADAEAALDADPNDVAALGRMALAHYLRADYRSTEEYANRLIDAAGSDDTAAALGYALLADSLLSLGNTAAGAREAEQAVAIDPGLSLGQAVRSNAMAARALPAGDVAGMDEALSALDQAVDTMGDESPLLQALTHNALAYTFSQEYWLGGDAAYLEQSEQAYEQAIELQPDLALFHLNQGYLRSADERYDEARDSFEAALAIDPELAAAQAGIGWAYFYEDENADAEEAFEEAIALDDGDYYAHFGLGRLRFSQADDAASYGQAVEALQAAAERNPHSAEVAGWLGEALLFQGFNTDDDAEKDAIYERAEEAYRAGVAIDEGHPFSLSGLGWILQYQEEYAESVEVFERAIAADDSNDESHNGMGWSLFYQDQFEAAEPAFRRAIALDDSYADAHFGLGRVLAETGRADEARAELELALSLDPGNTRIQEALDELGA